MNVALDGSWHHPTDVAADAFMFSSDAERCHLINEKYLMALKY